MIIVGALKVINERFNRNDEMMIEALIVLKIGKGIEGLRWGENIFALKKLALKKRKNEKLEKFIDLRL